MNRRNVFKLFISLGILNFFSIFLRKPSIHYSRVDVVFTLSKTMSFEQFRQSVHLWIDADKFESIQKEYQSYGKILSAKRHILDSNTIKNTFYFSDDHSLVNFITELTAKCNYNFEVRDKLGIKVTSYINEKIIAVPSVQLLKV